MTSIPIDMACNDPDNGIFAGRVEQISVGSSFLELTALRDPSPRLVELAGGRIRLAGRIFPITGSAEWVGNWCWNRYWFALDDAVRLIVWLHRRRFFHCDEGEERLFNLWRKEALDGADTALFQRLFEKEAIHIGRAA